MPEIIEPVLFLDDITRRTLGYRGVSLRQLDLSKHKAFDGREWPEDLYVVNFSALGIGQELLLSRELSGQAKYLMIMETGHQMMRTYAHFFPEIFTRTPPNVTQFIILSGGKPLDLTNATPQLFKGMINSTFVKLHRNQTGTDWQAELENRIGLWYKTDVYIILEECTASGATLEKFAELAFAEHIPKTMIVFPVCGSLEGIERLYKVCNKAGVRLIALLNSALIQVAETGTMLHKTDLGLQPHTVVTQNFYQLQRERYQGKPICWVGDMGDSIYKDMEHIADFLRDMRILEFNQTLEDWTKWPSFIHAAEFQTMLANRDMETFAYFRAFL